MQRGVVTLTNLELKTLNIFLVSEIDENKITLNDLQSKVLIKFEPVQNKTDDELIGIETSQEELETILDLLPAPTPNQKNKKRLLEIRNKLSFAV